MTEPTILDPAQQEVLTELDDLEPLFSDQEKIQPEVPTRSLIPSTTGTSAPFLSNRSLTDTRSNFPLFGSQAGSPKGPELHTEDEPPQDANKEGGAHDQIPFQHYPVSRTGEVDQEADHLVAKMRATHPQVKPQHRLKRGPATRPRRGPMTRASTKAPP